MKLLREYIDILFRKVQPELLLRYLESVEKQGGCKVVRITSRDIPLEVFRHYSGQNFSGYSIDEVDNFYYHMSECLKNSQSPLKCSVFHIIPQYMECVADIYEKIPKCKYQQVLNWREISQKISQDTLLMSYMAYSDWKNRYTRDFFAWNSVISTDNIKLQHMLERGLAENHFHLYGSTQLFPLSWLCLMNHPYKILEYFKMQEAGGHMMENLNENITLGALDNQMEWKMRIYMACWIRKELFKALKHIEKKLDDADTYIKRLLKFMQFPQIHELEDEVNALRYHYGCLFRQPDFLSGVCLDYAIDALDEIDQKYRFNAVLTGERMFLYNCFLQCYAGKFSDEAQDLFYLYLLVKAQFRSELIQVNQRYGFQNFSEYQDRKSDFWWDVREYAYEAHRLALNASLSGEHIKSLEARITPKDTWKKNIEAIKKIDRDVYFANHGDLRDNSKIQEEGEESDYFFVIHFIKQKLERIDEDKKEEKEMWLEKPRHYALRRKNEIYARGLKKAILGNSYYRERVWGIDACSAEIGCRPEVFATDFRFLRYMKQTGSRGVHKRLWITYHVGEDFLDIVDGLRAIDEAVFFLKMGNRDRIGHALALGIDPKKHYMLKRKLAAMPKQDLLDNYVWLLFRSLELGVAIDSQQRSNMEYQAERLLREIYMQDERNPFDLKDYFESWKLRGDHPNLYQKGEFTEVDPWLDFDQYNQAKKLDEKNLEMIRKQKQIARLYYRYQFGYKEKKCGQKTEILTVGDDYIALAEKMQDRMKELIFEKGIAIECNPSSNVLIGTFDRYDYHPIKRFNSYALSDDSHRNMVQLNVSINTDDQGVFDTLLENEFALMACALEKEKGADGKFLYSEDMVYDYLERIRRMGFEQAFRQKDFLNYK